MGIMPYLNLFVAGMCFAFGYHNLVKGERNMLVFNAVVTCLNLFAGLTALGVIKWNF